MLAGLLVYGNSLDGAFIFDDYHSVVTNPSIRHVWPLWGALVGPADTPIAGRPIPALSLAVNYAFGELNVRGYHVVNIAVHILCSLVLFGVVRRTLLSPVLRERFGSSADILAGASALLWLVHPLQTEPVNYVTQRTESLMGLFYLLTLYAAIRALDFERWSWWHTAAILSCALGMASKEVMVTAPLMVVLYDIAFRREPFKRLLEIRGRLYAALAGTWIILIALTWSGPRAKTAGFSSNVGAIDYAMNQGAMILQYLRLVVWPRPLLLDYGEPGPLAMMQAFPTAIVIAGLIVLTVYAWRRWPAIAFAGTWFFAILAPTSSVIPIATEVGAERRMYLPLAAVIALGVVGAWSWLMKFPARRWVAAMALVGACGVFGSLSAIRNSEYRSAETIWRTVVALHPTWRAHYNLGVALEDQHRVPEAVAEYQEALRVKPDSLDSRFILAQGLDQLGRFDEAIASYREYLRYKSDDANAHNLLGVALSKQEKIDEAVEQYRAALAIDPALTAARANLGESLLKQQKLDEAVEQYELVLASDPDNAHIHNSLGVALASMERVEEALTHYEKAVQIDPSIADAQVNLWMALELTGRTEAADLRRREAVRLNPALAPVFAQMAARLGSAQAP